MKYACALRSQINQSAVREEKSGRRIECEISKPHLLIFARHECTKKEKSYRYYKAKKEGVEGNDQAVLTSHTIVYVISVHLKSYSRA
jgi:hypothetical protein